LILASVAALSVALPALPLDGEQASLETLSSTHGAQTDQSAVFDSTPLTLSVPLSNSDDNTAVDVQTSMSAKAGSQVSNSPTVSVRGLWFRVVSFSGEAGSLNILKACQDEGMDAPCDHNSYAGHGSGNLRNCMAVPGFNGMHWSIQSHVQSWGNNQELTNMCNHKYFYVGISSGHQRYSHYNTAGSHRGAGNGNGADQNGGQTVCVSEHQPHKPIEVKGLWFKAVPFTGVAGSQNLAQTCALHGMEAPCDHNSYNAQHGGGCVTVPGFGGHWSIQSHVQAWGNNQELTNMCNHKYFFVGLGQYRQYSHYNTAGSHTGAGMHPPCTPTGRNPSSGMTVCVSSRKPREMVNVKGILFSVVAFSGVAGSQNIMETCRAEGMEALCDHNSYANHGAGACLAVPGFGGHWSIRSHVQSWGNNQELTDMCNFKYFYVGINNHQLYSHYTPAGSHEGAGQGASRNPNGGQTVCAVRAHNVVGQVVEVKGLFFATVPFSGVAGSENMMRTCQSVGMEAPCDHPSYIGHGGGCMQINGIGHFSIQSHVQSWGNNQELTNMCNNKYFFVGLNSNLGQYTHWNNGAGSHTGAGMHPPGNPTSRNPDGGETVCVSNSPPGPTCEVSAFGPWTPCSKSCGGGVQTRTRTVTRDGSQCPALKQQQACHTQECHTSTTDMGKTVLTALGDSLQKLSTTNNNLKADSDRTASLAAAAKTLLDEASGDMDTKKANMESAMTAAAAAAKKCTDDTNERTSSEAAQAQAVKTGKDSEVIDKELALIAQLKAKLVELTNTKSLQTQNLQSSEDITEGVNRAIRAASAGARPETAIVFQALEVAAGRQFQESAEIDKLLDQLIAKLENEKSVKRANVVAATKRAEDAKKVADGSCAASDAKKEEVRILTRSYENSVRVVDSRREEHKTISAMAATALKSFTDFQASFESEKATMTRITQFFNGGMKCSDEKK